MSMRIAITPFLLFQEHRENVDIHVVDSQKWRNDSHFSNLRVILTLGFETLREPCADTLLQQKQFGSFSI